MSEEKEIKESKKPNKFVEIILKNKTVSALVLVIIVLLAYFLIKTNTMQSDFEQTYESIQQSHITQMDSLKITSSEQTVKVFSWAIRSEMNRNNLEEVNNLFRAFVRENRIQMIHLVDPTTSKIILSTDKKNEGQEVKNIRFLNVTEQMIVEEEEKTFIVTPIMGINRMTGILVVEIER
ncbi:MAG: hypothetical protein IH619_01180 [Ignavibacterium sp.]|nr:hypothetical protein [Ignavibacterium sp.]